MQKARPASFAKATKPREAALHLKAMAANARQFALALKAGRKAAQAMWARSRDPHVGGPNETVLDLDERRLSDWRAWLKRAARQPELAWGVTPVCGVWQLQVMVHNFAPAVQKVVVEQQDENGTWRELAARFTIEFRAAAARPHSKLKREFTVPVDSPDAKLRLAVHGVGQVAVSHVTLTNGVDIRRAKNYPPKKIIGWRAPSSGLPGLKMQSGVGMAMLRFG